MSSIDTIYIRNRCDDSLWLHDQFRDEIKELCDEYDKAKYDIAKLKISLIKLLSFLEDEIQNNLGFCTDEYKSAILEAKKLINL